MSEYPSLYRVYDTIGPDGLTLLWQMYTVIGETPMCWYVITSDLAYLAQIPCHADTVKRRRKRVLKEQNGRRLCYTDKKRAMESYLQRKHWQLSHAAMSEARAKAGLSAAKKLLDGGGEITLPATEESHHIQGLGWGDY
jgi:hypothetical protein